jgi:hypothetical protein
MKVVKIPSTKMMKKFVAQICPCRDETRVPIHAVVRLVVIARSEATKQSIYPSCRAMDCFAEPVIGRRFAPTRWLAMTVETRPRAMKLKCPGQARA